MFDPPPSPPQLRDCRWDVSLMKGSSAIVTKATGTNAVSCGDDDRSCGGRKEGGGGGKGECVKVRVELLNNAARDV
jgi:hypothetical protein